MYRSRSQHTAPIAALPAAGCAALAGAALWPDPIWSARALTALMLLWPLLDPAWSVPAQRRGALWWTVWLLLLAVGTALAQTGVGGQLFVMQIMLVALPEEWFFRAYLLTRWADGAARPNRAAGTSPSGSGRALWLGNLLVSFVFSALHGLTRGPITAALVFVPSLLYGWYYLRTRDAIGVILLHAVSNLFYFAYLQRPLEHWLAAW